jgi:hypothetical protein
MKIIDKNRDYWDYLAYETRDDSIIYDRRGSIRLDQKTLVEYMLKKRIHTGQIHGSLDYLNRQQICFALLVGYATWIFELKDIKEKENHLFNTDTGTNIVSYDYSANVSLVNCYPYEPGKKPEYPIMILSVGVPFFKEGKWKWRSRTEEEIKQLKSSELDYHAFVDEVNPRASVWDKKYKHNPLFVNPILSGTCISSMIAPEDIYRNLEMYLSSLHNDKNQESQGLTDKDKAVNHGFDKKESFRNIHPRH